MGESQLRHNVLQGDGVYKSKDGGQTWIHMGLEETQVVSRIRIHPSDPNRVYVAALGHPFGPNQERGIFRTLDGGRTWEKILFRDERTGAIDLVLDPSDPNVLYATLWEVCRKPWILSSGGDGSGIFKSTDGGNTWTLINNQRDLWQRAFYFLRIQADPVDRETIYALNYRLLKSKDGGRTFVRIHDTHSDHHDLWIDPNNPSRMINGNDGGGAVSVNGGKTWTHTRYPTAQIYRLATTRDLPYHVCGAQQDNSTVCVPSDEGHLRNRWGPIGEWMYAVGGGESGYIAPHPANTDIFYAGATNTLTRYEMDDCSPYLWKTQNYGESWAKIVSGFQEDDFVYVVREDPKRKDLLYAGTEHGVYISFNDGDYWQSLSLNLPDIPVTGLVVEERDLVIATHGRSFWVLDNIEILRQIDSKIQGTEFHLFKPADAIRRSVPAVVDYYVREPGRKVLVEILDEEGQYLRTLYEGTIETEGVHRHSWDLRYPGAVVFPGIILEGGNPKRGPWAPPGRYQTRLVVDGQEQKCWFNVKKDPRLTDVTDADLKAQFGLALKIRDKESAANEDVILIRNLKAQVEDRLSKTDDQKLRKTANEFVERISMVEKELYQVKNQSPKDKIAFPIKLNDRLTGLRSHLERGDTVPTKGYYKVFEELSAELNIQLKALERILRENLPRMNKELERLGLKRIVSNKKGGE